MTPTVKELLEGKRFGVVLSAGFFGFYGHAGFLEALEAEGLQPSAYAGSSAGGLVAALAAAGAEPGQVSERILAQRRRDFWDPDMGGVAKGLTLGGHGATGLLKGERFRALLGRTLGVETFEQCQVPLALVATNVTRGDVRVFAKGPLAPAVHATCAYPGLFRAVSMDGELYWDGGLVDKAPARALADQVPRLEALLVHFLPSRSSPEVQGPWAYVQAMNAGMAALRREHFKLQLEVLAARGVPVYVIVSELPAVTPSTMGQGELALATARQLVRTALTTQPRRFEAASLSA